jgi:predicted transcriptional regulator
MRGASGLDTPEIAKMAANTTKDRVMEAVEKLPPDATIEDIMERLIFLAKVERGIEDVEAGKTISHEEVKRRFVR